MRERVRDKERLLHILHAIDQLQSHTVAEWRIIVDNDPPLAFAVVKLVEIIGEAVYMLTPQFRKQHPLTEWEIIEGTRHILVHGYYKIKIDRVFDILENDLPSLRDQIEIYLQEEDSLKLPN